VIGIRSSAGERLRARQEQSAPLLAALEAWLRETRAGLSRSSSVVKPIDYLLSRWDGFARFLEDGKICLTNNAAERALRGFALGRKSWLFAGSERGADRAAAMTTLIMTAKLNDVDPLAWLADVLARIAIFRRAGCRNCCPGTGRRRANNKLPDQDHASRSIAPAPAVLTVGLRFVYVAVILDAWSRLIVGYAIGRHIDARLTVAALTSAIARRQPAPPTASTTPIAGRNTPPKLTARRWRQGR
jgi:hypothetical protein